MKLCLGLISVDDKTHEIPAVQELIDLLDLKGAIVTADAMHCQVETAAKIADNSADYVLIAKGNQAAIQTAIRETLAKAFEEQDPRLRQYQELRSGSEIAKKRRHRNSSEPRKSYSFCFGLVSISED